MKSPVALLMAMLAFATIATAAETVSVVFRVSDKAGNAVRGLTASDFTLQVGGKKRPISKATDVSSAPLRLVVLLDVSGSTVDTPVGSKELTDFFQLFIRRGRDSGAVVMFAGSLTVLQDFTDDAALLGAAVEKAESLKASGGTALYDAVYLAAETLSKAPERTAILVISDGVDTASRHSPDQMRQTLANSRSVLYALSPERLTNGSRPARIFGVPSFSQVAEITGGLAFKPENRKALAPALEKIGMDLRSAYALTYEVTGDAPSPRELRKIQIETSRKGLMLRYPAAIPVPVRE